MALNVSQLKEEAPSRLREILSETKEQLFKYRMNVASGEAANPHEVRSMRREIARIETLLSAIEIVAKRSSVDEEAARASLAANNWVISKAATTAKSSVASEA